MIVVQSHLNQLERKPKCREISSCSRTWFSEESRRIHLLGSLAKSWWWSRAPISSPGMSKFVTRAAAEGRYKMFFNLFSLKTLSNASINYCISPGWHLDVEGQAAHPSGSITFITDWNHSSIWERIPLWKRRPERLLKKGYEHVKKYSFC